MEQVQKQRTGSDPRFASEQYGRKREFDPELLDVVRAFARSYYAQKQLGRFAVWSADDLINEVVVSLKSMIDEGKLYERVNRAFLLGRVIDAVRRLEKGNPKFQGRQPQSRERSLVRSEDLASYIDMQRSSCGRRETREGVISLSEAMEQYEEPETPAEKLRKKFEDEGCLWTRAFHEHLEESIAEMVRAHANELRKKMSRDDLSETAILRWIETHPGENPTNRWLAMELGVERETVARNIKILMDHGRIFRKPALHRGKPGDGRTRGKWTYFPVPRKSATSRPSGAQRRNVGMSAA